MMTTIIIVDNNNRHLLKKIKPGYTVSMTIQNMREGIKPVKIKCQLTYIHTYIRESHGS